MPEGTTISVVKNTLMTKALKVRIMKLLHPCLRVLTCGFSSKKISVQQSRRLTNSRRRRAKWKHMKFLVVSLKELNMMLRVVLLSENFHPRKNCTDKLLELSKLFLRRLHVLSRLQIQNLHEPSNLLEKLWSKIDEENSYYMINI